MEEFSRKSTIHIVKGQTDLCILTYFFRKKIFQFNVKGNLPSETLFNTQTSEKSYFLVSMYILGKLSVNLNIVILGKFRIYSNIEYWEFDFQMIWDG